MKCGVAANGHEEAAKRYVILRGFLTNEEQRQLVRSTLDCHRSNCSNNTTKHTDQHFIISSNNNNNGVDEWSSLTTDTSSISLKLGLAYTGAPMNSDMDPAVSFSRRLFAEASRHYSDAGNCELGDAIARLSSPDECSLTGIALLYGPNGRMLAHYDAPTQKGRRDEWLVGFSVGADTMFRCNDEVVLLESGDALVMDSMAVLHGVEGIVVGGQASSAVEDPHGLPFPGSRLGVLLWQAAEAPKADSKDADVTATPSSSDLCDAPSAGGVLKSLFMTGSDSEESDDEAEDAG
mmetsp:Transcript_7753/g.11452  ORF Transcript_7753/g.11452 Transcript_7753/m.11452 type:complete len:292 (+) Transcript_7753:56-931(+)